MTGYPRTWAGAPARHGLTYACALAIGLALFYRDFLATGFDRMPGDAGDGRLIIVYLEHWWLAFHGRVTWDTMLMFYPLQHTLALSDLLFGMSLPYSLFRMAGLDMFSAFQLTLLTLSVLGFAAMAALLERGLRCRPVVAAAGALLFISNINAFFEAHHPQLMLVALVPLVFLSALRFVDPAAWGTPAQIRAGIACILVEGLLICSSFYIGWEACFYLALLAGIHAVRLKRARSWRKVGRALWAPVAHCGRWNWLFLVLLLAIGAIFLWSYLPVVLEYGGRRYRSIFHTLPQLQELVDLSPSNWFWSSVLHGLWPARFPAAGPLRPWNGLPPAMLLGFLGALVYWRWGRRTVPVPGADSGGPASARTWALYLGVAVLLAWLLMVRVGDFSLWILPFNVFPGANGLRVVGRLQLVLIVPVIAVIALTADDLLSRVATARRGTRRVMRGFALPALALLLVVEQVFAGDIGSLSKADQRELLKLVGQPPAACQVFQLEAFAAPTRPGIFYDGDAIVIAYALQLPTVHGFTGVRVKGLDDMDAWLPGYEDRLARWWAGHGITRGICALDLASGRWRVVK